MPRRTDWSALQAQQRDIQLSAGGGQVAGALQRWRAQHDEQSVQEVERAREAQRRGASPTTWRPVTDREKLLREEAERRRAEAERFDAALQERLRAPRY
jgi:hypothetical protein